jgi:nitroreductase
MKETRMELMEAVKGRRSIRKYRPDPIGEETLLAVLEAVRWAPSWANTQCWEVIVVKDRAVKEGLTGTLPKGNPATAAMTEAPVLLVLCGKKEVAGYYKGQMSTVKGDWLMFDTGLAMENLCLSAHALGLGTVVVGMFDHKKAEEVLGVPSNVEVVAITPLGYPASAGGSPKRKTVSEFTFYEGYGKREG